MSRQSSELSSQLWGAANVHRRQGSELSERIWEHHASVNMNAVGSGSVAQHHRVSGSLGGSGSGDHDKISRSESSSSGWSRRNFVGEV